MLRSCLTPISIKKGHSTDLILSVKNPIVLFHLIPHFHRGFWSLVCGWKPRRGWWSGLQETSGPIPGLCEVWELQWGCTFPKELLHCIFGEEGSLASSRSMRATRRRSKHSWSGAGRASDHKELFQLGMPSDSEWHLKQVLGWVCSNLFLLGVRELQNWSHFI